MSSSASPRSGEHSRHYMEDSGLQVVPGQDPRRTTDEKEFAPPLNQNEKIPNYPGSSDYKWDYQSSRGSDPKGYYGNTRDSSYPEAIAASGQRPVFDAEQSRPQQPPTQPPQKRILGLRRRWFWTLVAVLILIIALAVGLGVGVGMRSSTNRQQAAPTDSAPATDPSPANDPSPTASRPSITTQTIALPSATLLVDCPSSNETVRAVEVDGRNFQFRKACGSSLYNPADPTANVTGSAISLDECISRCASANTGGELRCDRVCWKNSKATPQSGGAGSCFGYIGTNTTDTNTVVGDFSGTTDCDGAYLMNP